MSDAFNDIVINNMKREAKTLSKFACKSIKGQRRFPEREKIPDRINIRPPFFHDTDKIIHSKAYTRYIDKTQVFFLFQNDNITHRVLHVQLVSKIARVIGRCLRLNEDLIEAIALGHDLGHVPYGHDGEKYLNKIFEDRGEGYFCHNAQSVRLLMEVEKGGAGLNLTLQVLDGILAHNGEFLEKKYEPDTDKDWDKFLEEYKKCWIVKDFSREIRPMTLEGCVVRISDIISYIGRDIEDAITVKLIDRSELPKETVKILGDNNRDIINSLTSDLIKNSYGKPYLVFSCDIFKALKELLEFNYENIYQNVNKMTENYKIENMFNQLFNYYIKQLEENGDSNICTAYLKGMSDDYKENNSISKITMDYISGMTDNYFNNEFYDLVLPKKYGMYMDKKQ